MDEIDGYLKEDLGKIGDITSNSLFTNENIKAKIFTKEDCIIAGLKEAIEVFSRTRAKVTPMVKDGDYIKKGTAVLIIEGKARSILVGERLALNIIGKMSGIATETNKLVQICKEINPDLKIAATRKTTPGFRKFEKRAVEIGGGEPHRFGLFDAVLIKDNHIKIIGSIEEAINKVKSKLKGEIIEVEVENEEDAIKAAKLNVDIIMLDNFDPKQAEKAYKKIKSINKNILIEISGGVTIKNIANYALFADRISLGYLTHSIKSIDFSLDVF